jgi:hypothetical protein
VSAPSVPATTNGHDGSSSGDLPVTVMLRPLASGLPFGFFGLVSAATITGVQAIGLLPASASRAIALLLLPTVMLQLVGGIACLLTRDVVSASSILTFSGVWLGTALIGLVQPPHGQDTLALWYFAVAPVVLCLISAGTGKLALALVPVTGLPAFVVTGIWLYKGAGTNGLGLAAGILTFVLAAAGLYAGLALLHEDARRHTVLPTLRRGAMREAFTGDFASQLRDLEHEAGVRRYV